MLPAIHRSVLIALFVLSSWPITLQADTIRRQYDDLNRLVRTEQFTETATTVTVYGYDDAGNRIVLTRTVGPPSGGNYWFDEMEPDAIENAGMGSAVALLGDLALVGASGDSTLGASAGAAYVFRLSNGVWAREAKLFAGDGAAGDSFGCAVAIASGRLFVGAEGNLSGKGAVYVFEQVGGVWSQTTKITAAGGAAGDAFGCAIGADGDYLVVGAKYDDPRGTDSGAAYFYRYITSAWSLRLTAYPSDGVAGDWYGWDVDMEGTRVIIGAYGRTEGGLRTGAAYLYYWNASTVVADGKVLASDRADWDQFGFGVSISGDRALVGADQDDDNGANSGSGYIFLRSGASTWAQEAKMHGGISNADDHFGRDTSLYGDTAIVGAYSDDRGGAYAGSAYLFRRDASGWWETYRFQPNELSPGDHFGWAIAHNNDWAVIGATGDDGAAADAGTAWFFFIGGYDVAISAMNPDGPVGIAVSPVDRFGRGDGTTPFGRKFAPGSVVTLTAPAAIDGREFEYWELDSVQATIETALTITTNRGRQTRAVYASCAPPKLDGVAISAVDVEPCLANGIRITWPAEASNWRDESAGTRRYDILRDGVAIAADLAAGTMEYIDLSATPGQTYTYSVRFRNGCDLATVSGESTTFDRVETTALMGIDPAWEPETNLNELCGDGDVVPEPGERWSVSVRLRNSALCYSADSLVASLALNASSPGAVTLCASNASYGSIVPGAAADGVFEFDIDESAPCVSSISFDLTGIGWTDGSIPDIVPAFSVPVGLTVPAEEQAARVAPLNDPVVAADGATGEAGLDFPNGPLTIGTVDSVHLDYQPSYVRTGAGSTTIFSETFEDLSGWTIEHLVANNADDLPACGTGPGAHLWGGTGPVTSEISKSFDVQGYSSLVLRVAHFSDVNLDAGERLQAYYSADGGAEVLMFQGADGGSGVWTCGETFTFPEGISSLRLRFVLVSTDATEDAQIDDLTIEGVLGPGPVQVIYADNFSSLAGWTTGGNVASEISNGVCAEGKNAQLYGDATNVRSSISRTFDVSGHGSLQLIFDHFSDADLEAGEYLRAYYSADGAAEVNFFNGVSGGNDTWVCGQTYTTFPAGISSLMIRFQVTSNAADDDVRIDNFRLLGEPLIAKEDFEDISDWVTTGSVTNINGDVASCALLKNARLFAPTGVVTTSTISRSFAISGYSAVRLEVDHFSDVYLDAGERLKAYYSFDGGADTLLFQGIDGGNSVWVCKSSNAIPVTGAVLTIRFELTSNADDTYEDARIDNFKLFGVAPTASDWTNFAKVQLVAPGDVVTTLKDFGDPDTHPWDVTGFYRTNGAGLYSVRVVDSGHGSARVSGAEIHAVRALATQCDVSTTCFCPGATTPGQAGAGGFATAMRSRKAGNGRVGLAFGNACGSSAHGIYIQSISGPGFSLNGANWVSAGCSFMDDDSNGTTFDAANEIDMADPPPGGLTVFVVVGNDGIHEGSYGRSSAGEERPETSSPGACQPQSLLQPCDEP